MSNRGKAERRCSAGTLLEQSHSNSRRRGVVYVEVLLCLIPVFVFFLCVVQIALLRSAELVVQHAAYRGARAAIVVVDEDPERYAGAPRGDLQAGETSGVAGWLQKIEGYIPVSLPGGKPRGGARLQAIRAAAQAPLTALAPRPAVILGFGREQTLKEAVGGSSLARFAVGAFAYNRAAAAVTVRTEPGSNDVAKRVDPRGLITVRVTYLMHCAVPIAARLICNPAWDLAGYTRVFRELERLEDSFDPFQPAPTARVMRELLERFPPADEGARLARELSHVESRGLQLPLLLGGGRYQVITAEATLPGQGANYHRANKGSGGKS